MNGQLVGYVRVSSVDQNPERQTEQMKDCDIVFTEKASGKDMNRPELKAMMAHIRKGDIVQVASIDRLARNNMDLQELVKEINAKGVTIKFLKEGLVFHHDIETNSMSKMMLTMLAAIGEFERELIRERQREGIAIAKAKGKYHGRKPKLSSSQVTELRQAVASGKSKTDLAKQFGITRATLYSYLTDTPAKKRLPSEIH